MAMEDTRAACSVVQIDSTEVIQQGLGLFEMYYNSGRGRLWYENGECIRAEEGREFTASEQVLIVYSLLVEFVDAMEALGRGNFADVRQELSSWDMTRPAASLLKIAALMDSINQQLGCTGVHINNKLSEVEIGFTPEAIAALSHFTRDVYKDKLETRLQGLKSLFINTDYKVFAGLEYCKVTLFDKADTVTKILHGIDGGVVIGLGDSAVDVSFLALEPAGVDYRGYYVGDPLFVS